ncbi:hypothetical protein ACFFX1_14130 [Dactylosporangium sucinum]|uniref:Uncharacterized protein n=1 Tax=Dactylosporangium sucinum TaxID=1424081 RepID=A0A917U765_9ACTN|nr:hypothetical protein [Dactylosporangium sucinum]GGM63468.1 hypothetical protein GCM10007977_076350 [Dactylosporangium sucinum]
MSVSIDEPIRPIRYTTAAHRPNELAYQAPDSVTAAVRRTLRQRRFMQYNRLAVGVVLLNAGALWLGTRHAAWADPTTLLTLAQANLACAVIARQQHVVNFVCRLATRAPTTWPLRLRWALAKVYHFGGLHVGMAVSGTAWYVLFVASHTRQALRGPGFPASLVTSYALVLLLVLIVVCARPSARTRSHDRFEVTHRLGGWTVLVLAWINTILVVTTQPAAGPVLDAVVTAPSIWLMLASTASTALPWLRLRRVPITVQRPSSHVAVVRFDDHGVKPFVGSVRPISLHPLWGWHTFANIPAPRSSPLGYRMAVSRAGDWTSAFIADPPSHVWVRGVPTAGMANVRHLFKRVVFVATGSGIGPMLAHLMANNVPGHLVWVTRSPRETYGDELVNEILAVQPDATIWNTDDQGRPDVFALAYEALQRTGAEAVICIASTKVTWQVVSGIERLGIPAFGPIWDS